MSKHPMYFWDAAISDREAMHRLADEVERLEKVYTETLDELSRVKALNSEMMDGLKEALWAFESPPDSVGPIMIKIQGIIAKAKGKGDA